MGYADGERERIWERGSKRGGVWRKRERLCGEREGGCVERDWERRCVWRKIGKEGCGKRGRKGVWIDEKSG